MFIRCHLDIAKIDYNQIILYGMHVGHSFINSIFYTAWLVYTYTQNILIINLFKTLRGFRSGITSIIAAVNTYNPIWFINLDQAASISVKFLAMSCGEFSATSFWINGFISNYISIFNTYHKLKKISWFAYPTRNKNANESYKFWYYTRCTWPRSIFISNVSCSYQPAKESSYLGIPCLGIVDTNTYTHVVSIPIPGNDDSIDCLVFYNSYISKFILLKKNTLILNWFINTRHNKRLNSFKHWLKRTKAFNNYKLNYKKYKLLVDIKFRFNMLKNIQLGMKILFSHNLKYNLKNFEYLDIFKFYKRHNNKGIEIIILKKKAMFRHFKRIYSYLKALSKIYLNKKLWTIYYIVKKKFFQHKYFQLNLFSNNYFNSNIKIDRFYKTHLRWNTINYKFASKLYKFFTIYNFLKYKKLSTNIFITPILDSIFFKLIISQLFTHYNNFNINLNNNKITYKKDFKFFSFKNWYTTYKWKQKKIFLSKLFLLLNKKNWIKYSKYNRKNYINKIKFLYLFKIIKKKIYIKDLTNFIYFLLKKKLKFLKLYKKFKYYLVYLNFFKNLNILFKKYSLRYYKKKKNKFLFIYKKNYINYLHHSKFFRFFLKKKIKYIKYNLYIYKFLSFMKKILNIKHWNQYKKIIFLFIHFFFNKNNYISNYFLKFIKKIIFNIFWFYILPNIKYYIFLIKKRKSGFYFKLKKRYKNILKSFKYKQLYLKLFNNNNNIFTLNNINILNNKNLKSNIKKININKNNINYIKKKYIKLDISLFIYIFLKKINYKIINNSIYDKNKYLDFNEYFNKTLNPNKNHIHKNLNKYLKKFQNLFYNQHQNNNIIKNFKYYKKKKLFSYKNNYSLYNTWINKHSFFNIITYEYNIYLKYNPYIKNSLNYYNYLNYNNFIKWKRKKFINNLNWKIFYKYSSNNSNEFLKDFFIRFKILSMKKFIYKNIYNISLYSLIDKKKIIKKSKYYLGWFIFNKVLNIKDWFYQKNFFLFPTWFYNYKKKSNIFLNLTINKNIAAIEKKKIQKLNLIKNNLQLYMLKYILKHILFYINNNINYLKKNKYTLFTKSILKNNINNKKNIFNNKIKLNKYLIFCYNLRLIIYNTILDYTKILWNNNYPDNIKNYILKFKISQLNLLFSPTLKKNYLNKIRFNRKIKNWDLKKNLINNAKLNLITTLDDNGKTYLYINVLKRFWYTNLMLKKKHKKYKRLWINRLNFNNYSFKKILKFEKNKIIKEEKIKKLKLLEKKIIFKNYYNNKKLFQKKYNHIFLNNFNIGSSLNNLFNKFYHVPKINNYKEIKNYLSNYKILLKKKLFKKIQKKKKTNKKTFKNLKLLHKNYNNNMNISLSNYLKMYGFKWW